MNEFVYVYVDEDGLIEEISLNEISSSLAYYKLPKINSGELLSLKENRGRVEKYMLIENESAYFVEQVSLIYYNDDQIVISPRKEQEYEEDESLKSGYVKFDNLLLDFIEGTKDLHYHKVEETIPLLTITKRENTDYLNDVETLNLYKVDEFLKQAEIELIYRRKKKSLKVKCFKSEGTVSIYFTIQHDSTIILESIDFKLDGKEHTFKDIQLPKKFDTYSPIARISTFSFKEI